MHDPIPVETEAQLLTYLKLSDLRLGLLINFNTKLLKDGIRRHQTHRTLRLQIVVVVVSSWLIFFRIAKKCH